MTQVLSKLAARFEPNPRYNRLAAASGLAAIGYWSYLMLKPKLSHDRLRKTSANRGTAVLYLDTKEKEKKSRKRKINYNETFRSLKIILGFITSYQDLLLACGVSVGLVLRTLLDLWNIQVSTQIEAAIISADSQKLKKSLLSFLIATPTMSLVNNLIRFLSDRLRLNLRYNLSKVLYERYMTGLTYYHLPQNPDFQNVDQLLVSDVDKFCSSIVEVYNNLTKPVMDIFILVHRMTTSYTGPGTPGIMIGWLAFIGTILVKARQPLTNLIINETQTEGQLRFVHSRLIQNSEEVAFYNGNKKEQNTLMNALDELKYAIDDSIIFKLKVGFVDNIIGRYLSTIVGYLALARPFFASENELINKDDRLSHYYVSGRMMMKLAESITRVIMAGQDLSKLAAYTQRVEGLMNSMRQLSGVKSSSSISQSGNDTGMIEICHPNEPQIDFEDVNLTTPNGDILVKNLTFNIKPKQNVIIAGPNGSGKSSLFRVLGGLWTIESGRITRPDTGDLFYICQKPYMTLGTFRDQIIYPDVESRYPDSHLMDILKVVELQYLLDREHTLDTINDWQDVLSGGEKQRIALARLIYHKPKFAILDECTSAVAIDVEQKIYKYLSERLHCTLLSVSHSVKQLAKFHHLMLEFDGNGNFEFKRMIPAI